MTAAARTHQRTFAISIDELKELANGQVRSLCGHLLPNGRENTGYWEVGSIEGEKGQSLKINLEGATRGLWTDFSAPKGTAEYSGNLIQLVALVKFGGAVGPACQWLRSWLGLDDLDPDRLATEKARARKAIATNNEEAAAAAEKKRRKALGIYLSAVPLPGTPAETYLVHRGIDLRALGLPAPGSLRFHPEVYCAEVGRKLPALVAQMVNLAGQHVATHRTYLQPDGKGKATLVEAKKALGKYQGGFIPLWKGAHRCAMKDLPRGTPIYVSEGIEDGLSVAIARPSLRVIAAVALSNIGGLELPDGCPVYILGQRDTKMKAIEAFAGAVERLQAAGRDVFLVYPPDGVKDYNDLLLREQHGGTKHGGTD
jgi:hypothetical protein